MNELRAIDQWAGALLVQMSPAGRRATIREIAHELRRSQQARIAAQKNPDGSQYEPRKPRRKREDELRGKIGRIKRATMFARLRLRAHLTIEADESQLSIGFVGRTARIARVHQYGEIAEVVPRGPLRRYPTRKLLGLSRTELDLIHERLLQRFPSA